jgi:putative SOS response-associated peptidase YedK
MEHYQASFDSVHAELETLNERFSVLMAKDPQLNALPVANTTNIHELLVQYSQKDALPPWYTRQDLAELKWHFKALSAFRDQGLYRYHENGFDHLPTPIVTAGQPDRFQLFRWGLIPHFMADYDKAMTLRTQTLNCISEEMHEKPSFRDALKNGQRCLIPVTGFFEWRWLDDAGTVKIPYYVTFRDPQIRSLAGLYSRWKDPRTGSYYYSYTVLTTAANTILSYVHNHKQRMPVFIAREDERAWLNRDLPQRDVQELCRPSQDPAMRAYTISKLLTARHTNTNVEAVLQPMNYNEAIAQANYFLEAGDKKRALAAFKELVAGDKIRLEDLIHAASQQVRAELTLS